MLNIYHLQISATFFFLENDNLNLVRLVPCKPTTLHIQICCIVREKKKHTHVFPTYKCRLVIVCFLWVLCCFIHSIYFIFSLFFLIFQTFDYYRSLGYLRMTKHLKIYFICWDGKRIMTWNEHVNADSHGISRDWWDTETTTTKRTISKVK